MRTTRSLAWLATGLLAFGGLPVAAESARAAEVQASSGPIVAAAQCKAGATRVVWSSVKKPYALVGSRTQTIPAHARYSQTVTVERVQSYTAKVAANASVSASFKAGLFAELKGEVGFSVQKEKSSTTKISMTQTFDIPASSRQKRYAFFVGVRRATGKWVYQRCSYTNPTYTTTAWYYANRKGTIGSWRGTYEGAIDCAAGQKKGSMEAVVKSQAC